MEPGSILRRIGGEGVTVAVVDSGWDATKRDARVLPGVTVVAPDHGEGRGAASGCDDRIGHGTRGIERILHVAPRARIVPVKVFGARLETSLSCLLRALLVCAELRVSIVSLSLGTTLDEFAAPLRAVCDALADEGIVIIAAGDNRGRVCYPAAAPSVVGVAAGRFTTPFHFRYSRHALCEMTADGRIPGVRGRPGLTTSMAAATAAGLTALLMAHVGKVGVEGVRHAMAAGRILDRVKD